MSYPIKFYKYRLSEWEHLLYIHSNFHKSPNLVLGKSVEGYDSFVDIYIGVHVWPLEVLAFKHVCTPSP